MKPRILFVDDEPAVLRGLQRSLWELEDDWDMEFCDSASAALASIEACMPDVLISDHNMPGMTGLEMLKHLRTRPEWDAMQVVFLTGNNDQTLKRQALESGANDLLNKPVITEDLVVRIKSCLTLKSAQDQLRRHNELLEEQVRERTKQLEAAQFEIVYRLAKATELRDAETGNHNLRVAYVSRIIARRLGCDSTFQLQLFLAAMLHDIGKLGIADAILLKPGKLTPEEFIDMQRHSEVGSTLLSAQLHIPDEVRHEFGLHELQSSPFIQMAAQVAREHHERFDGTGYPAQLLEEEIALAARIVAVADVYDALLSRRPYKEPHTVASAISIIQDGSGNHFDPRVVYAFMNALGEIQDVYGHLQDQLESAA